jgi:hypothetical protein
MTRIQALKNAAMAATQGEWKFGPHPDGLYYNNGALLGDGKVILHFGDTERYHPSAGEGPSFNNQQYIEALQPATILALLELVEAQHRALEETHLFLLSCGPDDPAADFAHDTGQALAQYTAFNKQPADGVK